MNHQIKLVLADDHRMLREGFKTLLRKQHKIELVAEAENGRELIEKVDEHKPHVVITDIKMPVIDGVEACRTITDKYRDIGVIALSSFDNDDLIMDMIHAGATGYLLKNADKAELFKAIQTVAEGGTYFSDQIGTQLRKILTLSYNDEPGLKVEFSAREISILKLSCRELTSKEIAHQLDISSRTVETHKERMQNKVGAKNIVGVILYALKNNIISLDEF